MAAANIRALQNVGGLLQSNYLLAVCTENSNTEVVMMKPAEDGL